MARFILPVLASIATSGTVAAMGIPQPSPHCADVSIKFTATTDVREFPANFNVSNLNYTTVPQLPPKKISGTNTIAASYCAPKKDVWERSETLQILVHGASYTRTYWSGLEHPPHSVNGTEYSWIDYFSNRGFPTLAIDRLCNGESSHPNGQTFCQVEYQTVALKAVVDNAKAGKIGGRPFSKVILVGHSFGSVVVESFTNFYPNDVDSIILTGFTPTIAEFATDAGPAALSDDSTANQVDPAKYGSLDSSYQVMTNATLFIGAFFSGAFSPALAEYNFNTSGTSTIFETATDQYGQLTNKKYTGDVIALNGQNDGAVCRGNCGSGKTSLTNQVAALYPNAKRFSWHNTPNTGHCLTLHFTAKQSYDVIHKYLSKQGH